MENRHNAESCNSPDATTKCTLTVSTKASLPVKDSEVVDAAIMPTQNKQGTADVNPSLNREIQSVAVMLSYCTFMLLTEVCKQLTSYGMKYYNHNEYPIPQTQIVALAELFKFFVFLFLTCVSDSGLQQMKISLWYAIPSVIFVINNNVFYFALHYTTPPVWNILIQLRVILTALTYRLFFKQTVTIVQWIALIVLIVAIILSNSVDTVTASHRNSGHLVFAVCLAVFGSVTSVIGTIVMEFLFKNDTRQFVDKQTQLYLFSSVCSWSVYTVNVFAMDKKHHTQNQASEHEQHLSAIVVTLLVCDLLLACAGGFLVALVVKKFDNIVKLYTQALANMFTAIACSLLFAEFFQLNVIFGLCILLVFIAIIMYEVKHVEGLKAVLSYLLYVAERFKMNIYGILLIFILLAIILRHILYTSVLPTIS